MIGTRNLVAGPARAAEPRPRTLVSASAIGYYGAHGEEPLDEDAPAGRATSWRRCASTGRPRPQRRRELGMRVVQVRTGVVLDRDGGALAKMLPPFRLGVGGPVAGGRQYISWIHRDDLVGIMLAALDDERWSGPINATAPEPVTNRDFSQRARPGARTPVAAARAGRSRCALLYGEMAEIVTTRRARGARQGAGARLRVPPPAAGGGAALGARAA